MSLRNFFCALLLLALAACHTPTPYEKTDKKEKHDKKDFSNDPTFMSFMGRLRLAVNKHDRKMLATLMADDFGYRWDNGPQGETPFDYWDQRNLWGELANLLRQKFGPNDKEVGQYMVAPEAMLTDENYQGYRVGIRLVRGSWRFAYFVPAPPPQPQQPGTPPAPRSAVLGEPDLGSRAAQ